MISEAYIFLKSASSSNTADNNTLLNNKNSVISNIFSMPFLLSTLTASRYLIVSWKEGALQEHLQFMFINIQQCRDGWLNISS